MQGGATQAMSLHIVEERHHPGSFFIKMPARTQAFPDVWIKKARRYP
jgi:hypothetical protein